MTEIDHESDAIQDRVSPDGTCFGCGAANLDGLQLKSYLADDEDGLVAAFEPEQMHNAGGAGVDTVCGGIVGTLIDCHSLWTAITLDQLSKGVPIDEMEPNFVTGEFNVRLADRTPLDQTIHLNAWIEGDIWKKTTVRCELGPEDKITATGTLTAIRL